MNPNKPSEPTASPEVGGLSASKRCPKCTETKPLTDEHWYFLPTGKPRGYCRPCTCAHVKATTDIDAKRARDAKRYAEIKADPVLLQAERERKRLYAATPAAKAKHAQYLATYVDRPGVREQQRERSRAWREAHPDRVREIQKAHYYRNHTERLEQSAQNHARRASQVAATPEPLTREQWKFTLAFFGDRCVYCGSVEIRTRLGGGDHVLPLSRGGAHIFGNVVPCCRTCNARKANTVSLPTMARVYPEVLALLAAWNAPV